MALMGSLYAGWSGLRASSAQLGVVGDNIANVNTVGFKASRAVFSEALAQSMMGAGGSLGSGVNVESIQKMMSQGTLLQTGGVTDMAISGAGMFVLRGAVGGVDTTAFTRAGQFTVDRDGYLAALNGMRVQGFGVDGAGAVNGVVGDLRVGDAVSPPQATGTITFRGNLDSTATVPPQPFDPAAPVGSGANQNYNVKQSLTVYDSLGRAMSVDVYFSRNAAGGWDYSAVTDAANVQGATGPTVVASGSLTFDTDGNLAAHNVTSNTFQPVGATGPQTLTLDLGDPTGGGGTGREGITQYAGTSAFRFVNQDGYASGELADLRVEGDGRVLGVFTNGQTQALGQLALASFAAPDNLERMGGNLYGATQSSGQANVGAAGSGGRGALVAGALEQSNVDLSGEFIQMIGAQRLFQANSKTISTADQLLQELMQLKR